MISNKCCSYAKKKPAELFLKQNNADLNVLGIRKAEGGIRSTQYKNCFTDKQGTGINQFRPIFFLTDDDRKIYEELFNIKHSKCYIDYGLKRTGCCGCPYNSNYKKELEIIKKYEPQLYQACISVFGQTYEYMDKYREFCEKQKK